MYIYIYNGVIENRMSPHKMIQLIEEDLGDQFSHANLYFLTNLSELLLLMYRLYSQTFRGFVYFAEHDIEYDIQMEGIYRSLLNHPLFEEEHLIKPVYSNKDGFSLPNPLGKMYKSMEEFNVSQDDGETEKVEKLYYYQGHYYMFEPYEGERRIINVDKSHSAMVSPHYDNMVFCWERMNLD